MAKKSSFTIEARDDVLYRDIFETLDSLNLEEYVDYRFWCYHGKPRVTFDDAKHAFHFKMICG